MRGRLVNKKYKLLVLITILLTTIFTTGFTNINKNPKTVYRVYLEGKSLGIIESKKSFENYIDKKQNEIKEKYQVDKVYTPQELDIVKEITFENDIKTNKEIYNKIKNISSFMIDGYVVKIKGLDTKDETNGKTIKGKNQYIYVLDKKVFTDSVEKTVKSFIKEEDYNNYANNTQKEIKDTGTIIDNIYLKNKITIKKDKIPVNKTIYLKEEDLSKYLLFGTTEDQSKYTIKDGDAIYDVAFNNKISIEEFLVANPELTEKSLLYPGQVVTIGILKPQISVVEEDHVVKDEEVKYTTKTEEDPNQYTNYRVVKQAGENGLNRVTQKIEKVNGETTSIVTITGETQVLKVPVEEVVVKGTKQPAYTGGYGNLIVTKGMFGWPASCSSVSSGFGWRWGTLHDGMDIAGCGYGSNIFSIESGTVVASGYRYDNGQYITIRHDNGYYAIYAHLCNGCRYVNVGDRVKRGQVIGGMGQTGFATGVHLHIGIWTGMPYYGGTALNPAMFY